MLSGRGLSGVDVGLPVAEWRGPAGPIGRLSASAVCQMAASLAPDSADDVTARWIGLSVARKISLMPVHVGLVVLGLSCVFVLVACVRSGRGLARVPRNVIRRQIEGWSNSRLPLVGDAMRVYLRLARFQYHSRHEVFGIDG